MEQIIKKLQEKGYQENKELALNVYDGLNNTLKHEENLVVAAAGVWLGLFALLGFQFNTGNVVVSTGFLLFWTWRVSKAQHTKSLLSHLTTIISEDPPMKRNDLDFWMLVISTGLMWIGGFLKLLFGI